MLSPLSGLIEHDLEEKSFLLKVEGTLRLGADSAEIVLPIRSLMQKSADDRLVSFLEEIDRAGLPSLDFPGNSLGALLGKISDERSRMILSLIEPEASIDWRSLFADRKSQFEELISFLSSLNREVRIYHYPSGLNRLRAPQLREFGRNLPVVIALRLLGKIEIKKLLHEQSVIFLGPATIWALLDYLFEGRVFYSRIAAFRFEHKTGVIKKSPVSQLMNGASLESVIKSFSSKSRRIEAVTGNYFQNWKKPVDVSSLGTFNIYSGSTVNIVKTGTAGPKNFPCIQCLMCSSVCPVNASPYSLLMGNTKEFRPNSCIECGLCEYICPSGIELSEAIRIRIESDSR